MWPDALLERNANHERASGRLMYRHHSETQEMYCRVYSKSFRKLQWLGRSRSGLLTTIVAKRCNDARYAAKGPLLYINAATVCLFSVFIKSRNCRLRVRRYFRTTHGRVVDNKFRAANQCNRRTDKKRHMILRKRKAHPRRLEGREKATSAYLNLCGKHI